MSGLPATALLPPTGLALLAFVLLLFGFRRTGGVALLLLIALSMEGVARLLIGGLLVGAMPAGASPGAIIVLGGDAPDLLNPSGLEPGLNTLDHLRSGAALQRRTALPILVAGGQRPDARTARSAGMAASLREDFQVPVRWEEGRSQNIWQAARYGAALLRADGIVTAYLVADAWDERLAIAAFRRDGIAITPAPVRRSDPLTLEPAVLVAVTSVWLDSALSLRQWAGLACNAVPPCVEWMLIPTVMKNDR